MKTKLILALLALFVFSVSTFSCKKSTNCGNNFVFAAELSAESQALSNAASVYAQNPTTENCNNYKTAYQAYLNAARELEDCAQTAGQGAEYIQAINDAEASLNQLQC